MGRFSESDILCDTVYLRTQMVWCSECPPSNSSFVAHVLLYCFAITDDCDPPATPLCMFEGFFDLLCYKSTTSVDKLLKEVSALDKGFANTAIQTFIAYLKEPSLSSLTLVRYLTLAARLVRAEDGAYRDSIVNNFEPFTMALASTYQREMCSGKVHMQEGIDIKEKLATYIFSTIE